MYDQGKSGYWISEFKEIKIHITDLKTCGGITRHGKTMKIFKK
jgi:hypothetical protein